MEKARYRVDRLFPVGPEMGTFGDVSGAEAHLRDQGYRKLRDADEEDAKKGYESIWHKSKGGHLPLIAGIQKIVGKA